MSEHTCGGFGSISCAGEEMDAAERQATERENAPAQYKCGSNQQPVAMVQKHSVGHAKYLEQDNARLRARNLTLADECQRLRDENRDVLAENGRLRRQLDQARAKMGGGK